MIEFVVDTLTILMFIKFARRAHQCTKRFSGLHPIFFNYFFDVLTLIDEDSLFVCLIWSSRNVDPIVDFDDFKILSIIDTKYVFQR